MCRQPKLPDFGVDAWQPCAYHKKILHLQLLQFRDDRQEMKPRCKSMQKEEREIGVLLKGNPSTQTATTRPKTTRLIHLTQITSHPMVNSPKRQVRHLQLT